MKLRYKIISGFFILVAVALLALGLVLSHNTPCEPTSPKPGGADTMKAIVYGCYGSSEVLEYVDAEKPVPADDEVLVKTPNGKVCYTVIGVHYSEP